MGLLAPFILKFWRDLVKTPTPNEHRHSLEADVLAKQLYYSGNQICLDMARECLSFAMLIRCGGQNPESEILERDTGSERRSFHSLLRNPRF
jgi:hypothetical protein